MGVVLGNMIEPFVNKEFHMLKELEMTCFSRQNPPISPRCKAFEREAPSFLPPTRENIR